MGNNRNNNQNNNIPQNLFQKLNRQIHRKIDCAQTEEKDKKIWTTFSYHSPKIRTITNLFNNTNIRIAYRTTTTLRQLVKPLISIQTPEHEKSAIYKLTCNTCQRSYIGQTTRNLKSRLQGTHVTLKKTNPIHPYALHSLHCRHEYGNISDTMKLLKYVNTPSLLLPYEEMCVQLFHHNNQLIPEQNSNKQNPVFHLLHNTCRSHHT